MYLFAFAAMLLGMDPRNSVWEHGSDARSIRSYKDDLKLTFYIASCSQESKVSALTEDD
jgi:hypothetical protein